MHRLVMPPAFAGAHVDRHERFAEQSVAGAVEAVVIGGRHLDGQIHEPELRIRAHLRPDSGVAVALRRAVSPGLVAELASSRDGMEDPEAFAGARVETAHVAAYVPGRVGTAGRAMRCAHDDHVADYERRGVEPDVAAVRIDFLVEVFLQVHAAVVAERVDRNTRVAWSAIMR